MQNHSRHVITTDSVFERPDTTDAHRACPATVAFSQASLGRYAEPPRQLGPSLEPKAVANCAVAQRDVLEACLIRIAGRYLVQRTVHIPIRYRRLLRSSWIRCDSDCFALKRMYHIPFFVSSTILHASSFSTASGVPSMLGSRKLPPYPTRILARKLHSHE